MEIAVFKPIADAAGEGIEVWGKLSQKTVYRSELSEHVSDGWMTDAEEALLVADTRSTQLQNTSLSKEIESLKSAHHGAEQSRLDAENVRLEAWSAELAALDISLAERESILQERELALDARETSLQDAGDPTPDDATRIDLRTREGRALKAAQEAASGAQ